MFARLSELGKGLALSCIRLYQSTAPLRPKMCRYHPTCSEYTAQCIRAYGVFVGVALGIRRILRCNPFSPGGYDPIPERLDQNTVHKS
jgi:putative membrane protein insertion efficiency factor